MMLHLFFWLSLLFLLHSYILYPAIIWALSCKKKGNQVHYLPEDLLPGITIIMSVHNEEDVIEEKINSIFTTNYPINNITVIVGSDASTDQTNEILEKLSSTNERLVFIPFIERMGKANVMNQLVDHAKSKILVLTDANVMLEDSTLFELIKNFKNPDIGLVDTNMINQGFKKDGISIQEKIYISMEVKIKHMEGLIWGAMMGPFGGCYALRKELYSKVPKTFIVDDFYINMKVLEQGIKSINELSAKVHEDVSNDLIDEFHRKTRISTGNFQNMFAFLHVFRNPFSGFAFAFFSHKILRWLGPFFLISLLILNLLLLNRHDLYLFTFMIQCLILFLPVLDYLLRKIHIHILFLRFATHFLTMNLALIIGFFRFLYGVKTNVWQPTRRNQSR
jgi:cellulose synthase/poly-beta-1,6-N-acetylglucosamine synthase-like glycosyltransferase